MASVLITGGTGFIGSRLALRCLELGDTVRVLGQMRTRAEGENAEALRAAGAGVIEGSVTDSAAAVRACGGVDTLYHLAAAQHEANVPDRHFRDVNIGGTRNMLIAAVQEGVGRFVHGSTIGVYGTPRGGTVHRATPLRPDNIYGVTKLEAEGVVEEYRDRLPVAVARISETYGPGDRRLLKLFRALEKGRFFRVGSGRNLHHPVYIDDLVDGLQAAAHAERAPSEPFVLAGPEAISTDRMISDIARALGHEPPRLRLPLWPFLALARALEAVFRPLGVQPPLHRRRMNFFTKSFSFGTEVLGDMPGYRPQVSFPEGAVRTAEWYRDQGLLGDTGA